MLSPRFRFDGRNKVAQRAAEKRAAVMVTRVGAQTKRAIRTMVARSIREGIPPHEAARAIRGMIGLSEPQAHAAMNYRRTLVDLGHSSERVSRLLDRYVTRKIKERAETIARTEVLDALNEGMLESWEQAQDDGYLSKKATKGIILTDDELTCEVCSEVADETPALDEDFSTGDPAPPFHPRCRCPLVVNP